ncbi:carbon-nitrogen hydrolase [Astrocystis sublimbata]|nr:carbon-nitrogen hydrolase [Astrocystis sublimbata]
MASPVVPSTRIHLATASPCTQGTRQETLAQLGRLARSAGEKRADFLLLPEAYLGGYPRGADFGCKIGGRTEEGRDEFRRYFQEAIDLGDIVGASGAGGLGRWVRRELKDDNVDADLTRDGDGDGDGGGDGVGQKRKMRGDGTREELERIASETGVFIVVGLVERAGGSLYCAVVYVCPRRGIIGKRRKVMPTGTERLIWAQGSPATLQAVSTTVRGIRVNLAAAICWENYMPLLRQSLYAQNINLYFAPTADGRDTWLSLMRTIGIEGRCFVVSSNMCVRKGSKEEDDGAKPATHTTQPQQQMRRNSCITEEGFEIALPSAGKQSEGEGDGNGTAVVEDEDVGGKENGVAGLAKGEATAAEFISRGGSSIVSPFGEVLAGPQWEDDEGIIYAEVDLEDCVRGRLDLDAAGSYSRNDAFKFSVEGLDLDPLPYYT